MTLLAFIGGALVLVLLLDTVCRIIDRCDYIRRLKRDNEDLLKEKRDLELELRVVKKQVCRINAKLENRVSTRRWAVSTEAERRCAELERELQQAQKTIKIKDAMLRALLPENKKEEK